MIGGEPHGAIAVLPSFERANSALLALLETGFDMRSVTVLGPGTTETSVPPELDRGRQHSIEVARYWARWGGIVGAGVGAAVIGIPAIGAVVGLGAFAPVLAAVPAATAAGGAVAAALVGLGIHDIHAARYEGALADGKVLLIAHHDDPSVIAEVRDLVLRCGAERVDTHGLRTISR